MRPPGERSHTYCSMPHSDYFDKGIRGRVALVSYFINTVRHLGISADDYPPIKSTFITCMLAGVTEFCLGLWMFKLPMYCYSSTCFSWCTFYSANDGQREVANFKRLSSLWVIWFNTFWRNCYHDWKCGNNWRFPSGAHCPPQRTKLPHLCGLYIAA